ncbi:hypothetical protein BB560_005021 [Smittium megazygosporum]|uniref:Nucleolar GTP-binding protein 1 n=1 Tax=Smittium megazygosporum TaxID=133381 RepID=A0A2T9Z7M3_9FUNG|nr:hypothetical protein BB560_005021 [Smittium megazygosporum]
MSQALYNFKRIRNVPSSSDFIDIVLSRTQRKTPTVVHPGYNIGRIRQFYMRKVKFTQESFDEKLSAIIADFPQLDNVHPFYADLMNVLYDKDHYKLALGQINTAKHLIDSVGKDYVRLLKFGDSLYRCKQLKKAAMGRMATIMKRQKDSLAYLEQVRMHLSRLPSIDTNTRTLLVCGYPNVGKSSFLNKVTRADVDVQPYAFTTKSLFVGHMDYKYLRWQVIDTPGILDHELEERNTIEMQAITALAHLRACVLFFIDVSEQCGYSIDVQLSLFHSIKPLFGDRPTLLVMSKSDAMQLEDLPEEVASKIKEIEQSGAAKLTRLSNFNDSGIMETRNMACEMLLQYRIDKKLKGTKIKDNLNRINLSIPQKRDDVVRVPHIPETVKSKVRYEKDDPSRPLLEKDFENMSGGAGVYSVDMKKNYMLESESWKYDVIPEIIDGKNIADFVDPDIEHKLALLEKEEEEFEAEGVYAYESNGAGNEGMYIEADEDEDEKRIKDLAKSIREKKQLLMMESRLKKSSTRSRITTATKAVHSLTGEEFKKQFGELAEEREGADRITERAKELVNRAAKRHRSVSVYDQKSVEQNETVESTKLARLGTDSDKARASRAVSVQRNRAVSGLSGTFDGGDGSSSLNVVNRKKFKSQRKRNLMAFRGDADRQVTTKMPKHLFSGKRKAGSTDYR